jgi:hypothetical protein
VGLQAGITIPWSQVIYRHHAMAVFIKFIVGYIKFAPPNFYDPLKVDVPGLNHGNDSTSTHLPHELTSPTVTHD